MLENLAAQNWQGFNCYAYAISGRQATPNENLPKAPGAKSGAGIILHPEVEDRVNIEALGTKLTGDGLKKLKPSHDGTLAPKDGYYLIAAFIQRGDYHFIREDSPGRWSHKPGMGNKPEPIGCFTTEEIMEAKPFEREKNAFKFAGFYLVPDKGLSKKGNFRDYASRAEQESYRG